jgi:hypothetical protein
MRHRRVATVLVVTALALVGLLSSPALAHEERTIAGGKLVLELGFTPEPAVAGQPIAVEMDIHDAKGQAVVLTDAQLKQLAVHLFAGKLTGKTPVDADYKQRANQPMPLHATPWIAPGHYETDSFVATTPGDYSVHVATKDPKQFAGVKLNELFLTGPDTFGPVDDPAALQFPVKVPTNAELAARQDVDLAATTAYTKKLADLQQTADQAKIVFWVYAGLLGLLALALLVHTVRGARRDRVPDTPSRLVPDNDPDRARL